MTPRFPILLAIATATVVAGLSLAGCSDGSGSPAGRASAAAASAKTGAAAKVGAAATTPATTPSPAAACMVGTWHADSVAITSGSGTLSGGAGATWTIGAGGGETVDWTGSAAFTEKGMALFHYLGTETEQVVAPGGAATSGSWSARVLTDSRQAVEPTGTKPVPSTAGVTPTGTWSCSGSALTIDSSASGSSVVVTLTRAS